jgi:glycosyltransferase involved in cell wall biosynthesis
MAAHRSPAVPVGSGAGPSFRSVLHLNEKGGRFGGTEEYIDLLTTALRARGVSSHLVCGVAGSEAPAGLDSLHLVEGLGSRTPEPTTAAEVTALIAELDPDVVYLHNLFDPAVVTAVADLGRPVLWYVHDHYLTCLTELRWRRDTGACAHRLGPACLAAIRAGACVRRHPTAILDGVTLDRRQALSETLSCVDAVIVVSEHMRRSLLDAEPAIDGRIHRLHRPVRRPARHPRRVRRDARDRTTILCAGRITAEKGQAMLIEALGAVRSEGPVQLRIAGVVEDRAYWRHCQDLQQAATARNPHLSVEYLGHLDYAATDRALVEADIVTVPSQWPEPLGAIALEAMAAGAVAVASDIGGLGDVIADGVDGVLVDPYDPADRGSRPRARRRPPARRARDADGRRARARSARPRPGPDRHRVHGDAPGGTDSELTRRRSRGPGPATVRTR